MNIMNTLKNVNVLHIMKFMSKLKKLIMMAQFDKSSLPSEYRQLEYLECTGTQYIDLGYPLGYYHRVVLIAETTDTTNTNYIFGNSINTSNSFALNSTNYTIQVQRFDGTTKSINLWREGKCTIVCDKEGISVDNEFNTWQKAPFEFTTDGNCYLCAVNATTKYPYKGKIYSCQIYENGSLIHDYIPAFNANLGRPGIYDLVTGVFLTNNGTGEFAFDTSNIPETIKPYLCFEAIEDGFQAEYSINPCEYSIDNRKTWNELPADTLTPAISAGSKIYFRGRGVQSTAYPYSRGTFSTTKLFNISGNMLSMVHGSDFLIEIPDQYTYTYMFRNNKNIVNISDNFLNIKCGYRGFMNLFGGSSVSKATLYNYNNKDTQQYYGTFVNSQLKDVEIKFKTPTTMLQVFEKTQIESVVFPMTSIAGQGLLYACQNCKSLKTAKILAKSMSGSMPIKLCFNGCSSLNNLTFLITTPLAKSNSENWLTGVAEEGTIILNKNITWNPEDYRNGNIDNIEGSATLGETITWGIPAGWEIKYCDPDNIEDVRNEKW